MGASAEVEEIHIVALGDSLTEGYQLPKEQAYPAQLEKLLHEAGYPHLRVSNQGISGDTTAGGRARINRVLAAEPDIVIVALGANDFLRGVNPASSRENLNLILHQLTQQNIDVILVGMKAPANIGPAFQKRFNAIFTSLAEAHPVTLTYDFLTHVAGKPALNLADGIHPNAQGYRIVAQNLLPVVMQLLEP
jgi:acyl-CoA thioesterase-1